MLTLLGVPGKGAGAGTVQGQILIIISQARIFRASLGRYPSLGRWGGDPGADYLPAGLVQGNLGTRGKVSSKSSPKECGAQMLTKLMRGGADVHSSTVLQLGQWPRGVRQQQTRSQDALQL